jgi:hypothetical protein
LKAHILIGDHYEKVDKRGKELMSSQMYFCEQAKKRRKMSIGENNRIFIPKEKM